MRAGPKGGSANTEISRSFFAAGLPSPRPRVGRHGLLDAIAVTRVQQKNASETDQTNSSNVKTDPRAEKKRSMKFDVAGVSRSLLLTLALSTSTQHAERRTLSVVNIHGAQRTFLRSSPGVPTTSILESETQTHKVTQRLTYMDSSPLHQHSTRKTQNDRD